LIPKDSDGNVFWSLRSQQNPVSRSIHQKLWQMVL